MKKMLRAFLIAALAAFALPAFAGSSINPAAPPTLGPFVSAPIRNNFTAAYNDINSILNQYSGTSAPAAPSTFQSWADISSSPAKLKFFDGTQWVQWGALNTSTHAFTIVAGGVTIALTMPSYFVVTGSPASSGGTLAVTLATQVAHSVLAGPTSGSPAAPTFRIPTCADLSDATDCNAAAGQLPGTTTNDNAAAGKVGEYVSSSVLVGSAVSLTTATPLNVTSISLTAGDWDVEVNAAFTGGATTVVQSLLASISTTTASIDSTPGRFTNVSGGNVAVFNFDATVSAVVPRARFSLTTTTTIYFVAQATFSVSTASVYGIISARRAR